MMTAGAGAVLLLLIWGTVVALDLVSGPQALLARPLVTGAVAGAIVGDVEIGLRVGVLFELFALDVLPIGAARYPDYGPATVATVAAAAGSPWELSLGASATLGLLLAILGGWTLQVLRHANARAIQARTAELGAGDRGVVARLHWGALGRDALRGLGLTALGLLAASFVARDLRLDRVTGLTLTLVVVAAALSAVIGGAIRSAGRGARLRWLAAGAGAGLLGAIFR